MFLAPTVTKECREWNRSKNYRSFCAAENPDRASRARSPRIQSQNHVPSDRGRLCTFFHFSGCRDSARHRSRTRNALRSRTRARRRTPRRPALCPRHILRRHGTRVRGGGRISIILAKSAVAFATVKYFGAGYLCFLGIRMILDARKDGGVAVAELPRVRNPLWQGVMTEVLNPKTALFFLSFIPQFVNRGSGHIFLQFVLLGTLSVTLNTSADIIVTLLAGPLGQRIRGSARFRRRQRTLTGAVMIGLGTYVALGESK